MQFRLLFARTILTTLTLLGAFTADAQSRQLKDRTIEGRITNAVTGYGLKDTINVEIMTLDSVLLVSAKANNYYNNWPDETSIRTMFDLPIRSDGSDVIIRLSHPDYETACYTVRADKLNNSAGFMKIRKLSLYERSISPNKSIDLSSTFFKIY